MSDVSTHERSDSQRTRLGWIVLCAALLMIGTFDMPGRDDSVSLGSLDYVSLFKLACRLAVVAISAPIVLYQLKTIFEDRSIQTYLPWLVLAGWAFVSVLWSPLKTVSFGQAMSFAILLIFSIAIALRVRSEHDAAYVVKGVTLVLAALCLLVSLVNIKSRQLSGLARHDAMVHETGGLIHPTHAGATAGLTLLFVAASALGQRRFIKSPLLVAGIAVVASYLLIEAASRTALIALPVCVAWIIGTQMSFERRFRFLICLAVGIVLFLVADPGMSALKPVYERAESYFTRGDSKQVIKTATGRQELWKVLWKSWEQSPWIGYGYFIGTRDGIVDVWDKAENRPAHNVWLQSLVSMGIVGFALLVASVGAVLVLLITSKRTTPASAAWVRGLAVVVGIWFLIWSSMDSSILGPVGPEPVSFFVCLGLLAAAARFERETSSGGAFQQGAYDSGSLFGQRKFAGGDVYS